jgi:hypothetical protein
MGQNNNFTSDHSLSRTYSDAGLLFGFNRATRKGSLIGDKHRGGKLCRPQDL